MIRLLTTTIFTIWCAAAAAQKADSRTTVPAAGIPAATAANSRTTVPAADGSTTDRLLQMLEQADTANLTVAADNTTAVTATAAVTTADTDTAAAAAAAPEIQPADTTATADTDTADTTTDTADTDTTAAAEIQPADTTAAGDSDLIRMHPDGSGLRLEIAGYGITLGNRSDKDRSDEDRSDYFGNESFLAKDFPRKRVRPVRGSFGLAAVEFGVSTLVDTHYGPTWAGEGDFMEIKPEKSFCFSAEVLKLRILLDRQSHWWLSTGLRVTYNDLVFNGTHTLQRIDGIVRPVELDPATKKSKLAVGYLSIPLGVTFSAQRMNITLRATGDLLTTSHYKYKKPNKKEDTSGLTPWQWCVGGVLTYRNVGIYANYALTPLFRHDVGPETHILSMGLYLGF